MKMHAQKMNKKGAIELSMTTIIIIVISIVILIGALSLVRNLLAKGQEATTSVTELTETELENLFEGGRSGLNIKKSEIGVKQGRSDEIDIIMKNGDSKSHPFYYSITLDDGNPKSGIESWFSHEAKDSSSAYTIESGKGVSDTLIIRVPDDAPLGIYYLRVKLHCSGCPDDGDRGVMKLEVI